MDKKTVEEARRVFEACYKTMQPIPQWVIDTLKDADTVTGTDQSPDERKHNRKNRARGTSRFGKLKGV